MIFLPVSRATLAAKYSSGKKMMVSESRDSTTLWAFPDVQQMSVSALTSA